MVQEMVFTCQDTQLNVWTPCEAYKVTARILERPRPPGCSPAQLWGSWQPEDKMRADQVLWIPLLLSIKCVRHKGVWLHCIEPRNFIKPFNRANFQWGNWAAHQIQLKHTVTPRKKVFFSPSRWPNCKQQIRVSFVNVLVALQLCPWAFCSPSGWNLWLREGFPKKSSCSFGFCPNEGGEGPAQICCPLFTNCIYWVNLGMGREGETPAQIFWHIGVQKKRYKLSKLGGGRGNLDKIQKNSYFWETVP